ncbi:MAG: glycosyltransferase family 2 protein [bacterium]|nr:glycosyltransferase family 2 protein [bacterium]
MSKLSVVIITLNEEANLARCLESIKWVDEIVVIDSQSTDRTLEIAREYGVIVHRPEWRGFGPAKREGVAKATGDWILSLDADEEVSPELADEIRGVLGDEDGSSGFYIPRRTQFLGRWIYHCGWYPDPVLRLFRKAEGDFDDSPVHEKVVLRGRAGRLKSDLLHYSYPTLDSYFVKFNRYTNLASQKAYEEGARACAWDVVVRPFACFVKHYFLKRGFLDGLEGLIISVLSSCYVMTKYAKLRDLARRSERGTTEK